jgi:hypothetical protein
MRSSLLGSLVITAAIATWSMPGLAQSDDKLRAGVAYTLGTKLALEQKWAEAAAEFALADALAPNDTALDAALEASIRADDAVLGMNLTERAERSPSTRALRSVAAARQKFEGRVALVEVPCVALATPCKGALDGKAIVAARTWVVPGTHSAVFESEPGREIPFEIAAGSRREVVPPPPLVAPPVEPPPRAAPPPPREEPSGGVSGLWILVPAGATVAAAAVTAGFGAAFLSSKGDFEDAQGVAAPDAQQTLIDETEAWQDRTNVMLGVSAVCAAATAAVVVAVLATGGEDEAPVATLYVAPSASGGVTVGLGGRF